MTIYTPDLYTITETREGSPDEWFVMIAPIDVISTHFYMHPEAGQRIIRECKEPGGKCVLYLARGARIQNGNGMFIARLHSLAEATQGEFVLGTPHDIDADMRAYDREIKPAKPA